MSPTRQALVESGAAAVSAYIIAQVLEAALVRALRPTEWELASVSDMALAVALGIAVYLWRRLFATRRDLAERERAELVVQTQLSVAAEIQRRLLPAVPAAGGGFEWAAALRSAGKIGGDFYDFVELESSVWIVLVADVSGKGIPAAMALGSLRSAFRAFARQGSEPAEVVRQLSTALYEEWCGAPYATCIVATLELATRTATYTNAGHPAAIVAGRNGVRHLSCGGPPAGLLPNATFEQELVQLHAGDICLLVTDGVTEALEGDTPLERDLEAAGHRHDGARAADLCQAVMARALRGHGPRDDAQWDDDRTVVVVAVGSDAAGTGPIPGQGTDERPAPAISMTAG